VRERLEKLKSSQGGFSLVLQAKKKVPKEKRPAPGKDLLSVGVFDEVKVLLLHFERGPKETKKEDID